MKKLLLIVSLAFLATTTFASSPSPKKVEKKVFKKLIGGQWKCTSHTGIYVDHMGEIYIHTTWNCVYVA